jgi:L-asparaginase
VAAGVRIRLLAVGGTISCVPRGGSPGALPTLTAAEIVESLPQLVDVADLELGDFATIASYAVTPSDMLALAQEVTGALEAGCDGVLVTHGTDSIEETAYALALMVPRTRAVVLTGAMRGPSLPGSEGPANLLAAAVVAATPGTDGLGPVVVLNDEIHTARFVAKSHSTRLSTFVSAGAGPVGEVVEGRAHLWFRPLWEDYVGLPESLADIDVELVRMVTGGEETLLRAAVDRRPQGIVIDGFGGGHVPPPLVPLVSEAIEARIPVVTAPRPLGGRTLERTYRIPGAEFDLIERGVIPAGHLSPHKARLRLMVGLALGREPASLFPVS